MKVNAFTPLFQPVTPISKVKFRKSDTGAGPEELKKVSKYVVHMSKLLVYDYEVMATSRADAERKATTYLNANEREIEAKAKIDTWQIDDVLSPEGVRMRSYL